jgi:hypothetical protein
VLRNSACAPSFEHATTLDEAAVVAAHDRDAVAAPMPSSRSACASALVRSWISGT